MDQPNCFNVFQGRDSVIKFYNPDLQPPLPLVEIPDRLNPFREDGVRIYAKMLNLLPAHNIKALPALNMLMDGNIPPNTTTIVEQSSGSTVISLSIIGRVLHGIEDVRAYITNKTSPGRMKMLRFFGLQLVLYGGAQQPTPDDSRGGIYKAQKLAEKSEAVTSPNQYENPLNPGAHVRWTGPQLLKQLPEINVLCAPMGTGGAVTGIGGFLKKAKPGITVVGVCNANGDPVPGPRPFPLFQSVNFPWRNVVDTVAEISSYESFYQSMALSREGLVCGPSSGMTLQALYNFLQTSKENGSLQSLAGPDGTVSCVFLCCDLPYQYLDDYFFKLGEENFRPIVNKNLINVDTHLYNNEWEIDPTAAMKVLFGSLSIPPLVDSMANGDKSSNGSVHVNGHVNGSSYTSINGTPPSINISHDASETASNETNPVLLDLRSSADFSASHLPNAVNLPLSSLREDDESPFDDSMLLEAQWLELEELVKWKSFKGRRVVLVCYAGDTAKIASSVLRARGVEALSVRGGMEQIARLTREKLVR